MADLTKPTIAEVAPVDIIEQVTLPAGEAIDAGELVGIDANGKFVLADADTGPILTKGVAISSANQAGITITAVRKGTLDVGDIFTGTAIGASIYSSGTPGLMADAAVGGLAAIGEVVPAWGYTTVDKLLRVDL